MAEAVTRLPGGGGDDGRARPLAVDYLAAAYLAATGILAAASISGAGARLAALHLVGLFALYWVAGRPLPTARWLLFFRLVYPLALTPLLYLELATMNQLHVAGYFDRTVQAWEQFVFRVQLSVDASDWYGGLWFSEVLHFGYLSYYLLIPTATISAYLSRGPRGLERVALTTGLAFFVCYLCFSVFPVAGPRYEFPGITGTPSEGLLFDLVHRILEGGSAKGTAFPSSHVAATVSAWMATGRENRRVFWIMAPFAVSLTLGTVYGRFHYGVDTAAGLLIAAAAFAATPWLMKRLEGIEEVERASLPEFGG
jgi:membrane-associated phospholipid phosphatase